MEYNKQVNNNSFGFKCGSLESFFNYVDKFYKFAGMYKTTFIDPNDKEGAGYWSGFVNWMLMENNIQLLVTAKNLEQARKLKKKETEMESQKELDVELRKNGGDIKKAKEEIVRKKAINKRAKYYLPIIKKEFEKKGKTVKQSILKSMAEDRAEEELDNV